MWGGIVHIIRLLSNGRNKCTGMGWLPSLSILRFSFLLVLALVFQPSWRALVSVYVPTNARLISLTLLDLVATRNGLS
jgi:hypothetical protein